MIAWEYPEIRNNDSHEIFDYLLNNVRFRNNISHKNNEGAKI